MQNRTSKQGSPVRPSASTEGERGTGERLAGPALNAEVAEKVMGLRFWKEQRGEYALCYADADEPWLRHSFQTREHERARYSQVSAAEACRVGFFVAPPCYSSEIAHAWKVVEKMRELGYSWVRVEAEDPPNDKVRPWIAGFHRPKSQDAYWRGADTAPLAICRAALAALASKTPQSDPEGGAR
jgi:hypothetical protein